MRTFFRLTHGLTSILLRLLTLLMTGIYLLAAFSPHIPPIRFSLPAILGLFFPMVFVGQFLFLLLWLFRRRYREVLFLVFIFAISFGSISAYFPVHRSKPTESLPEGSIKVLSYNVCAFDFKPHTANQPNPTLQYIRNSNADIVCLQEAAMGTESEQWVSYKQLRQYLGEDYPYIHLAKAQPRGSSLMLLSKFPITKVGRLPLDSHTNGAIAYRLNVHGKQLLVVNVHLESFRLKRADGDNYLSLLERGDAVGIREAMDAKLGPTFRKHNIQANYIHEFIQKEGADNVLVCGDFNDTPVSYTHAKIGQGLEDAYIGSGNGFGFSFDTAMFIVRIDHILASPNWEARGCFVDNSVNYSDHYPIQTYLVPRQP